MTPRLPLTSQRKVACQDHAVAWDALAPALKEYFGTGLVDSWCVQTRVCMESPAR